LNDRDEFGDAGTAPSADQAGSVWPPPPGGVPELPHDSVLLRLRLGYVSGMPLYNTFAIMVSVAILFDLIFSICKAQFGFFMAALLLGLFAVPLAAATCVCFLLWTYNSYRNLQVFGIRELRCTPGLAVGCFFMPIAGFIMPPVILSDLWKASDPDFHGDSPEWKKRSTPLLIPLWWITWLAWIAATVDEVVTGQQSANAVAAILFILSGLLAAQLVQRITARQETKVQTLTQ
jgi:hypothetical protein